LQDHAIGERRLQSVQFLAGGVRYFGSLFFRGWRFFTGLLQGGLGLFKLLSQFSDFFRIFLQQQSAGLWLDTDVLLFRPFRYRTDQTYFAMEDSIRIGSPVWHLPSGHPIIAEYESLLRQDTLMPNWLGLRRGVLKPLAYRLRGQAFSPPDLGITLYGNDGFTRLAKRHRCYRQALPKHSFYHWAGAENRKVFEKKDFSLFLNDPRHIGLHIHKKAFASDTPVQGSLWEWMMQRYR
jgi:hypothetical protein